MTVHPGDSYMTKKTTLAAAIGTAVVTSLSLGSAVQAAENPFGMTQLSSGYMVAMEEGKCGGAAKTETKSEEGKCGGAAKTETKTEEGKCGGAMKTEPKTEEGKCGAAKKAEEGKCGEGKCGGAKKAAEEGKCGGNK
jgi:uncharacterized low-complexity protein